VTTELQNSATQSHLVFRLESVSLGVPEEQVLSVNNWNQPTPLPFAPDAIRGIVAIEGRMFTVIEIGSLLGLPVDHERPLIVAFRGEEQLALCVDSFDSQLEAEITVTHSEPSFIKGSCERNGEVIQILEVGKLFGEAIRGRERRRRRI
jgi:chemotaxis signal transduction protein